MVSETSTEGTLSTTCGRQRRDDAQRAEWTFHKGIPIPPGTGDTHADADSTHTAR